jgi:hypothetical protein
MFGARHGISPPSSSSPCRRIFPTQGSRPCCGWLPRGPKRLHRCGKLMDFPIVPQENDLEIVDFHPC